MLSSLLNACECVDFGSSRLLDFVEAVNFVTTYIGFRYFFLHISGFCCRGWNLINIDTGFCEFLWILLDFLNFDF